MVDTLHDYKKGQQLYGNANKIAPWPSLWLPFLRFLLSHDLAPCATPLILMASTFIAQIIHSQELGELNYKFNATVQKESPPGQYFVFPMHGAPC